MPKIPTINRQYNQTSGGISPDVAALPGRALQGFGQAISGVSDVYQLRKVAERNTKLLKIENMMNDDKRAFADMLRMDTNYDGLEERADKVLTGFQDKYSKEIQNDPKGLEAVNRAYGQFSNELRNMAWERRNNLHITERNIELDKAIKNKSNDYALETDPDNRKAIMDTTFALIDAGVQDGTLDAKDAYKIQEQWKQDAEQNRIEQMILKNPVEAEKALKNGDIKLDPNMITKYQAKVKDISNAYQVDDIVSKATAGYDINSDEPFDIQTYYENIKKATDDPEIRKAAFAELERMKRVKDQTLTEKYNYNTAPIIDAFMADENFTVNDAMKMPEYLQLTEPQQIKVKKAIEAGILTRNREKRALEASERAIKNQEQKEQQQEYDTNYLQLRNQPDIVYEMDDNAIKATALDIGEKNVSKLFDYRNKLRKNKSIIEFTDSLTNNILDQASIMDADERTAYITAIDEYIGDETDPSKIRQKVAEAMKYSALKKGGFFSDPKVQILKPIGKKNGKNVYELPNGEWQIGE